MNAPLDLRLTKAEFYRWLERQEARYELERGRPVMMAYVSRAHWIVTQRIWLLLASNMDLTRYNVGPTDLSVEVLEDVRFPDLVVEPVGGDLKGYAANDPVLLVEVLSPSSVGRDMTIKPKAYGSLSSLEVYLVASQDEPIVWLWQRPAGTGGERAPFPEQPVEIAGRDQAVRLDHFGIELPLAEIYQGIGTIP